MLRKVRLYGKLAKFVGHRVLEADVKSAAEAIRFLLANWPELEGHMSNQYYKVSADNWEIGEEELHYPTGDSDIKVIPVVGGAGGGTGKMLLGAALIGLALVNPFGAAAIGTFGGSSIAVATVVGNVGAALVLSGAAELLSPVPKTPETVQDRQNSFSFSGTGNTSRAGVSVPVCYGQVLTGSVVVSAAIDTVQVEA